MVLKANGSDLLTQRPWKALGCLAAVIALCLGLYLGAWPLVKSLVILPAADPAHPGLVVEGPSGTRRLAATRFGLDRPHTQTRAWALWQVSQPGLYHLVLECDDAGSLAIDRRTVLVLKGVSAHNRGEVLVRLSPGLHFLELRLRNGPGKGWLTLKARPTGQVFYSRLVQGDRRPGLEGPGVPPPALLEGNQLVGIDLGNLETWLQVLEWVEWLALAGLVLAGLGAAFLLWRHWPLVLPALVLVAAMWASSGTLAPYGTTQARPALTNYCLYVVNQDDLKFRGVMARLQGETPQGWREDQVIRRILYPLLAWVPTLLLGFRWGGFLTTVLITLAAFVTWVRFLERHHGRRAALTGAWLLATYPGVCYWAGLPYSYVMVVPGSLWGLMLLHRLGREQSLKGWLLCCLGIGVVCVGYDLLPFLAPAAVALVWWRGRRLWRALLSPLPMLLPQAVVGLLEWLVWDLPWLNKNTQAYTKILAAYFNPEDPTRWARLLTQVPEVMWRNFFDSNFWVLPGLFLLLWLTNRGKGRTPWQPAEICLGGSILLVFLFNNLAPPYPGWQFRGEWIARLYQPVFAVLMYFCARRVADAWRIGNWPGRLLSSACAIGVVLNAWICFGPLLGNSAWASRIYHRFYMHGRPDSQRQVLELVGRRPLGLCACHLVVYRGAEYNFLPE